MPPSTMSSPTPASMTSLPSPPRIVSLPQPPREDVVAVSAIDDHGLVERREDGDTRISVIVASAGIHPDRRERAARKEARPASSHCGPRCPGRWRLNRRMITSAASSPTTRSWLATTEAVTAASAWTAAPHSAAASRTAHRTGVEERWRPGQVVMNRTTATRPGCYLRQAGGQGVRAGGPGLAQGVRIHRPLHADADPVQ